MTITIADHSFVGLIGQTGSGKSTLIQHFNGLLLPTKGRLLVNGKDVAVKKNRKAIRRTVGLVFQYPEHQLFEETVYKDIAFGPQNMGLSGVALQESVHRALEAVALPKDILQKSPFDLSGGQMRRVAIAGVLAMNPEVLVLDEPTAGLDPVGRDNILKLVDRLYKLRHMTVILVSHRMEDIARFAKRLIVMHNGCIEFDGTPREIFTQVKKLKDMGLDAPKVAHLMQALRHHGFSVPEVVLNVEEASEAILQALGRPSND